MARIAVGGFQHETNTFAQAKADLEDFEKGGGPIPPLTRGPALLEIIGGANIPIAGFVEEARGRGHEMVPLPLAGTMPSAQVTRRAYETVAAMMIEDLRGAGHLDAVYLDLHGAMVADDFEDGEGELLRRVRDAVGRDVPVVASLDYHANVTPEMMALADGLVGYRTYPHVDRAVTGARAARLLDGLIRGDGAAFKTYRQIPFLIPLTWQCTETEPTRSIIRALESLEHDDVGTLSYAAGFPLADIHHSGPTVFGYGRTQAAADNAIGALYEEVIGRENEFVDPFHTPDDAVRHAMAVASRTGKPVILADTQDNPGAGSPSDTVGLLAALVAASAEDAIVAILHDPEAAGRAHAAGVGAEIDLSLGGKSADPGNDPFIGRFRVEKMTDGAFTGTGPMYAGIRMRLGPTALLRIGGVGVVVATNRAQAADRSILRHVGIEPEAQKILALKSSVHFRADFEPIASAVLVVVAPGPNTADTRDIPYKRVRPDIRIAPAGPPVGTSGR